MVLSYFVLLSWWFRSNLSIGREESRQSFRTNLLSRQVDGNDGARTRIIAQRGEKYLTELQKIWKTKENHFSFGFQLASKDPAFHPL